MYRHRFVLFLFLVLQTVLLQCVLSDISMVDHKECRSKPSSEILVCDFDGIFTDGQIKNLITDIIKIYNETTSPCNITNMTRGITVRLAVTRLYNESLYPSSHNAKQKHEIRMLSYSKHLLHQLTPTEDLCNDNVLLFISKEDKGVQIVVDTAVEALVTREFQNELRKKIIAKLNKVNFMEVVQFGLNAIGHILRFGPSNKFSSSAQHKKATITIASVMIVLIVVFGALTCSILSWRKRRKREREMNESYPAGTTTGYDSTDEEDEPASGNTSRKNSKAVNNV